MRTIESTVDCLLQHIELLDARWYRRLALAVVLAWCLASGRAEARQDGSDDAQRAAQKLAAVTAAKVMLKDLEKLDVSRLEKAWTEEVLANPGAHRTESRSRETFAEDYTKALEKELEDRLARIHASFNPKQEPDRWFTRKWLVEHVEDRYGKEVRENLDANRKKRFPSVFERARTAAVQGQLADLTLTARPSLEEVDHVNESGWNTADRQRLRQALVERMGSGAPLLEEAQRELQRLADDVLDDAHAQFAGQQAALERPVSERARSAEDVDRALAGHVEAAVQAMQLARGGEPVYQEFPSIERQRHQEAASMAKRRFADFVRGFELSGLEPRVRELVDTNTSQHRQIAKSRELCRDSLIPQATREIVAAYAGSSGQTFRKRLEGFLESDPDVRQSLSSLLESKIEPVLAAVRGDLARRQLDEYFPAVSSQRWQVPENTLVEMHEHKLALERFEDVDALPFISEGGRPYERQQLLEETEQLALSETSKLLHEGKRAWKAQDSMVDTFEEVVGAEIRAGHGLRTPELWQDHFIEEFESQWHEERLKLVWRGFTELPPHAAEKYLDVFGHAEMELRDLVRRQFELAQQIAEEPQVAVQKVDQDQIGQAGSESETGGVDSPTNKAGPGVPGGPSEVDGQSKGTGTPGSGGTGGGEAIGCLMWLLGLLFSALLAYSVFRLLKWFYHRALPALKKTASPVVLLSLLAGALLVTLVVLMVRTSGVRIRVDPGELEGAREELTRMLGVQPDVHEHEIVYDLGFPDRIIVEERAERKD